MSNLEQIEKLVYRGDTNSAIDAINSYNNPNSLENELLIIENWKVTIQKITHMDEYELLVSDIEDIYPYFTFELSKVRSILVLIQVYFEINEKNKIQILVKQTIKYTSQDMDIPSLVQLIKAYGYYVDDNYVDCTQLLEQLLKKTDREVIRLTSYELMGKCFFFLGKMDDSNWHLMAVLEYLNSGNASIKRRADVIQFLFWNAVSTSEFEEAERWFTQLVTNERQLGRIDKLAKVYKGMASLYFFQDVDRAIGYYLNALQLYRELNDLIKVSMILNQLASIYTTKSEFQMVSKYHREIIEIGLHIENDTMNNNLGYLAQAHFFFGEYSTAINYHLENLEIMKAISPHNKYIILLQISNAYSNLGFFNLAQKYLEEAKSLIAKEKNLKIEIEVDMAFITLLLAKKDEEKAYLKLNMLWKKLQSLATVPSYLIMIIKQQFELSLKFKLSEDIEHHYLNAKNLLDEFPNLVVVYNNFMIIEAQYIHYKSSGQQIDRVKEILHEMAEKSDLHVRTDARLRLLQIIANEIQESCTDELIFEFHREIDDITENISFLEAKDKIMELNFLKVTLYVQQNMNQLAMDHISFLEKLAIDERLQSYLPRIIETRENIKNGKYIVQKSKDSDIKGNLFDIIVDIFENSN